MKAYFKFVCFFQEIAIMSYLYTDSFDAEKKMSNSATILE
jgi:hypothetical protein